MWDFDADFDTELDLGSRRKPVQWVAVAPPVTERTRQQVHKRAKLKPKRGPVSNESEAGLPLTAKAKAAQVAQAIKQRQKALSLKQEKTPTITSGVHNRTSEAVLLEPEDDEGNVEYKLRLKQPNPVRFQQLVTQMQYRLSEGNGECYYYLGVEDDGYPRGLTPQELEVSRKTLKAMSVAVNATIQPLREMPACKGRVYVIFRISRICLDHLSYTDLRIAVAGSVDSGKSTLVAVLTNGRQGRPLLDNGQGSARMSVFKHKHEIETGRTSSLSHHMLAYDGEHRVLNYADVAPMMPSEIAAAARKVVRFIDLGGHQKYLKTALYGLTSLLPDYVLVCICPLTGFTQVTKEHLAVALALELPLAFLITKVDVASPEAVKAILQQIQQMLVAASSGHCITGLESPTMEGPFYTLIETEAEAVEAASHATQPAPPKLKCVPVFSTAATTGTGLPVLHAFLSHLKPQTQYRPAEDNEQRGPVCKTDTQELEQIDNTKPTHFQVDQTFEVRGVGSVVSGTLVAGGVKLNQELLLGTQSAGSFTPVVVTSIQRAQVPVKTASAGQHATLAIHSLPEAQLAPAQSGPGESTGDLDGSLMAARQTSTHAEVNQHLHPSPELIDQGLPGPSISSSEREGDAAEALPTCESLGWESSRGPASIHESTRKQASSRSGSSPTDRRHDVWQSSGHTPFQAMVEDMGSGRMGTRTSSSYSSESDRTESPRMDLVGRLSQRLSAEDAIRTLQDLSINSAASEYDGNKTKRELLRTLPQPIKQTSLPRQDRQNGSSSMPGEDLRQSPLLSQQGSQSRELLKASNPRKGTVLLDKALEPEATWQFEAVMVLLSGFWPARGLLSGGWPPQGDSDSDNLLSDACLTPESPGAFLEVPQTKLNRISHSKQSVRQAARVVSMAEVALPPMWQAQDCHKATGCDLEPAISAAACLLSEPTSHEGLCGESCVAVVQFRFIHQPEWLQEGARFVVRDCTESCTAGAGVVRQLLPG